MLVKYYDTVKTFNRAVVGLPSFDGRGPSIEVAESVAVSAQSAAPEACMEFVFILLSDSVQEKYGMSNGFPVNKAAYDADAETYIDFQHQRVEYFGRYQTESELRSSGINPVLMDSSTADELRGIIEDLHGLYSNDITVNAIITEEMPAYFEGQKTLDQVIPVLEDRIQNLLNERG